VRDAADSAESASAGERPASGREQAVQLPLSDDDVAEAIAWDAKLEHVRID